MENLILKSGFDNLNNDEELDTDTKLHITSLITVFMENALQSAGTYVKHSNRKTITSIDISMSLKRELFTFLNNDDIESRALEIFKEFKKEINEEDDEEDEEDDEEDEEDEEDKFDSYHSENEVDDESLSDLDETIKKNDLEDRIDDQSEVFHKSICDCKICKEINEFSLKWKEWKPSNNIETILDSAIEKIDSEFNLV